MTDEWFEDSPTQSEVSNWLNQLAAKFGKTFPVVTKDSAKPIDLAHSWRAFTLFARLCRYAAERFGRCYQLGFDDAAEIPKDRRAEIALLMRRRIFHATSRSDVEAKQSIYESKMLRLIQQIYEKKKWWPTLQAGAACPPLMAS